MDPQEPPPAPGDPLARDVLHSLETIEKKVADLKPSFWKATVGDLLKIAVAAGATLWATQLAGHYNLENARVGAVANAEAAERIKDFRETRREWADSKNAFQNYFINVEKLGVLPASAQDSMKADVRLVHQIDVALIPSALAKKLDEFRKTAG